MNHEQISKEPFLRRLQAIEKENSKISIFLRDTPIKDIDLEEFLTCFNSIVFKVNFENKKENRNKLLRVENCNLLFLMAFLGNGEYYSLLERSFGFRDRINPSLKIYSKDWGDDELIKDDDYQFISPSQILMRQKNKEMVT